MIFRRSVESLQRSCKSILRMDLLGVCTVHVWLTLAAKAVDQEIITCTVGQSVTLPCKAPSDMSVLAVEWCRRDLESYVLSYRDTHLDSEEQDLSYMHRVDIDRQMQNGDLSLQLRNVTASDGGIYECKAFHVGPEVLSIIKLNVRLSDEDGAVSAAGTAGNHLQLSVLVLVIGLTVIL